MLENNFAIGELQRKVANIVRIGVIKEIDYEKAKVKVKMGELLTDFLPYMNEQVIVFSPLGELSLGVVLAGIYQQNYPAPENKKEISSFSFEGGTRVLHNKEDGHLEVSVADKITLKVGESEIEVTKNGIKLKGKRIDLN